MDFPYRLLCTSEFFCARKLSEVKNLFCLLFAETSILNAKNMLVDIFWRLHIWQGCVEKALNSFFVIFWNLCNEIELLPKMLKEEFLRWILLWEKLIKSQVERFNNRLMHRLMLPMAWPDCSWLTRWKNNLNCCKQNKKRTRSIVSFLNILLL